MQKKSLIYLLIFFLFLNSVLALDFEDVNITSQKGELYHGEIEISYTNSSSHTFTIYDITLNDIDGFYFTEIPSMDLGNTSILNFTYKSNETREEDIAGRLTYSYLSITKKEEEEIIITIDENGFSNPNETVHYNDTVTWKNTGNNTHTITDLNDLNDFHTLLPNETYSRKFIEIGQFLYFDEEDNYVAEINTIDNIIETATHSPNYDDIVRFKIKIDNPPSKISAQVIPNEYTMKHNQERKGVLLLSGNETLYDLNLVGDWFTFEKNDFQYKGTDEIIEFTIKPSGIDDNDETGKAYDKIITLSASNSENIELSIKINIEQYNFTTSSGDAKPILVYEQMTPAMMIEYCKDKYGDDAKNWEEICGQMRVNITQKVIEERVLHPDITEVEAKESIEASKQAKEGVDRLSNKFESIETNQANVQTNVDELRVNLEVLKQEILTKLDPIEADVKEKKKDSGLFLGLLITAIIIGSIVFGIRLLIKKIKDGKPEMELEF